MKYKINIIRYHFGEFIFSFFVWIFTTMLFLFIKIDDLSSEDLQRIYGLAPNITKRYLYVNGFIISSIFGLINAFLHAYIYNRIMRKASYYKIVLTRLFLFFCVSTVVLYFIFRNFYDYDFWSLFTLKSNHVHLSFYSFYLYLMMIDILQTTFLQLRRSLGVDFFQNFIKSKYSKPKTENRVFMFIDLVNSTPTVEKLGAVRFSSFIQDCFMFLSDVVIKYNGIIYQYVGDEVVINWKKERHFEYDDCLEMFFEFQKILNDNYAYFIEHYQLTPRFRCSLNDGEVSVAFVGDTKREIAFHGNVLHVASRLESVAKDYDADMVISDSFYHQIKNKQNYDFSVLDNLFLRGVNKKTKAYTVKKKNL